MLTIGVLSSHRAFDLTALRRRFDVTCALNRRPPRDRGLREAYDRETAELLQSFGVDVVLLLGYLYIVTEPLLAAFPDRILNVHDGLPEFPGLHATRDAVAAGARETYSIVHIVTPELDAGPIVARSKPFPVAPFARQAALAGHGDIVRAYAYAQREWMIRSAWPELIVSALEQVGVEEVAV